MKTALICGITGQDGAYLAQLLLEKGYRVVGTSRDSQVNSFSGLRRLGLQDKIELLSMELKDTRSVLQVLAIVKPDEVYNLAGQSSVSLSFEQPVATLEGIATGTLNLLESMRFLDLGCRFYNASSSECFGDTYNLPAHEGSAFNPRSPYAVAKAAAFWEVSNYREAYGMFACSGILFNHESPLRPERFVTQKIVKTACRIANGSPERLSLGNLDIQRDWGWAQEYVKAMWMMLQQTTAMDFVIATGKTFSLKSFVQESFAAVGLNWCDHVDIDSSLMRPTDLRVSRADPSYACDQLGWSASMAMPQVVGKMVEAALTEKLDYRES